MSEANPRYDVIIVGARVAGSASAIMLSQLGARVLLLEKAIFPSPTISVPVVPAHALAIFDKIGVLSDIEALGSPPIQRMTVKVKGTPGYQVEFPSYQGRNYSLGMRRERMDEVVARYAGRQSGVTLREGFHVTGLVWDGDRVVGVKGRGRGQENEETLRAALVVGADGAKSIVARQTQAHQYNVYQGTTCLYYRYYSGFNYLDPNRAYIYRHMQEGYSLLVFPADNGTVAITCGIDQAQFEQARQDATGVFERNWRSVALFREMGRAAEAITPTMGYAPHPYYYRKPYGVGWALVGDAGYLKDPVAGQGVYDALRSAELMTQSWAAMQRGVPMAEAMKSYQQQRDAETRTIYQFTYNASKLSKPSALDLLVGEGVARAFSRDQELANYFGRILYPQNIGRDFGPANIVGEVAKSYARRAQKRVIARLEKVSRRLEGVV